MTAQRR